MGVIRKEELFALSQSQANIPIYIQNIPYIKRHLLSRWKPLTAYCSLKNKGLVHPRHQESLKFSSGCLLGVAGYFDANPAVVVSKPLAPFMLPGCK